MMGMLLTVMAVLSMVLVANWHNAGFHVEAPQSVGASHHVQTDDLRGDPDHLIHQTAHSLSYSMAMPGTIGELVPTVSETRRWTMPAVPGLIGISGPSLLRPPRV